MFLLLALAWLGRGSTVDEDDLADDVTAALAGRGQDVTGVSCEDDLAREVGASVRCSGSEAGERRAITVTAPRWARSPSATTSPCAEARAHIGGAGVRRRTTGAGDPDRIAQSARR